MSPDESKFGKMLENAEGQDSSAMVPAEGNSALAVYSDTPDFAAEDMILPQLRLAQGLTAEVQDGTAKPGQWLISAFDPEEEVQIVPLGFARLREYRDAEERTIKCRSIDAITGIGDPGGECAVCPLSMWTGKDDSRKPPECSFSYGYVAYSVTHDALVALRFAKTALTAGKLLNTVVARKGLGKCAVSLKSTQRKGPRGSFYVPAVTPVSVTPEILARAVEKARQGV